MCVAAIAWQAHPRWRLVVAGNRDEFHDRPAAPLTRWQDGSGIVAGRDLRAGGTWLGVTTEPRLALVTNFRVEGYPQPDRLSRGGLITGWLTGAPLPDIAAMNPFNLLLADAASARVVTNWPEPAEMELVPGVHGLSNGPFAAPWPKTRALCTALEDWLAKDCEDFTPLFAALADRRPLPGPGPEQRLSSVFIDDPHYGTRCSTVLALDRGGSGLERLAINLQHTRIP
ncbi:MAG: NRDE family protein [Sphingomonadales bacterium]|nr:NRDE family protein [Sphingomonadales bacterium]